MNRKDKKNILPSDIAKYFLALAINDGELISPLKMQKLVYYAYAWYLVKNKKRLFDEKIQAWPMGPVVPSLYSELKKYGSSPITEDYLGTKKDQKMLFDRLRNKEKILTEIYQKYAIMTAFELVVLTHGEKPWLEARKGLRPDEKSVKPINDQGIFSFYKK